MQSQISECVTYLYSKIACARNFVHVALGAHCASVKADLARIAAHVCSISASGVSGCVSGPFYQLMCNIHILFGRVFNSANLYYTSDISGTSPQTALSSAAHKSPRPKRHSHTVCVKYNSYLRRDCVHSWLGIVTNVSHPSRSARIDVGLSGFRTN